MCKYTGVQIRCWGGSKISNVCAILKNNSAFESSCRDLCFGAIITLKENKFEKDIFLKVFYPPKRCRFFNFCRFFRVFLFFSSLLCRKSDPSLSKTVKAYLIDHMNPRGTQNIHTGCFSLKITRIQTLTVPLAKDKASTTALLSCGLSDLRKPGMLNVLRLLANAL